MYFHYSGQTVFDFPPIEGITLSAGEEVDEDTGEARDMWIGLERLVSGLVKNRLMGCFIISYCIF